jgi:glycosyltransferase involved in cell wall biosynthesis
MQRISVCFVTEIDIDRKLGGAIANDVKTLKCLRKLANVDVIYLPIQKYRSVWLAFPIFILKILRSSSKCYKTYFCRGLFASFILIALKPIHRKKVVHNTLSVPFASIEVSYSLSHAQHNKLFMYIWYSLMRFLEKVVPEKADAVIVAAETYGDTLLENGIRAHLIQTVPFYVEDAFFQRPIKLGAKGAFEFCYVGGFHPYHMLLPVLEAFESLLKTTDAIELRLVGEGPLRNNVEDVVARKKLTHKVSFFGRIPHESIPNFLSEADSAIIPTTYGLSTSLLEAAAAGKAILTLRRKGDATLKRYFRHEKEIYIVSSESPAEITKAMKLLLEDSHLRSTIAKGARRVAQQHFTEEIATTQLEKLMRRMS